MAADLLDRRFGGRYTQALAEPELTLARISAARLPSWWKLGLARPRIIIWTVAPDISKAVQAARPFVERRLEVRCVSVDARETVPGREWGIRVAAPADEIENWEKADALARILARAAALHLEQCPEARDRLHILLPPDRHPDVTGIEWDAAGGAKIKLNSRNDPRLITADLYYDWWTEGESLKVKDAVHRVSRRVKASHPGSWPWLPGSPEAECNRELAEGLAAMATDYWKALKEIGALELDTWAFWKPA